MNNILYVIKITINIQIFMKNEMVDHSEGKNLEFLFSLVKCVSQEKFANNLIKSIPSDKLTLVICKKCKLVQLDRNFNPKNFLYSKDYGYRTGINSTMTNHVKYVAQAINRAKPKNNDYILDIKHRWNPS